MRLVLIAIVVVSLLFMAGHGKASPIKKVRLYGVCYNVTLVSVQATATAEKPAGLYARCPGEPDMALVIGCKPTSTVWNTAHNIATVVCNYGATVILNIGLTQ